MSAFRTRVLRRISNVGTKYMPFADAASEEVPLSRLLRLSLFQVTVGMALVLMVGTLNRVMIVELQVPASLVAIMISLPLLFAPFRALIGYKSDTHKSALGWRRVPYIWKGTMWQFGGFAVMPFALLVLSGYDQAADAPKWIGYSSAALAFLLVGAGLHMVQTVGLALATDLVEEEDQPKVVGLMYVMLLVGMIVTALVFGALLSDYSPGRLISCIQGAAVITIVLNMVAMWKQEPRDRARAAANVPQPEFREAWAIFASGQNAMRLLVVIALGTMGFGMADVLLEPYGGEVLGLSVAMTTRLTAVLALGTLIGFAVASYVLVRGTSPMKVAWYGAAVGVPGFVFIVLAAPTYSALAFATGTLIAGLGAGLFGHGTLTATMRSAPRAQIGLALGAWGAVQATAAGLGVALGGVIRDVVLLMRGEGSGAEVPYIAVFSLEIVLLIAAMVAMYGIRLRSPRTDAMKAYTP